MIAENQMAISAIVSEKRQCFSEKKHDAYNCLIELAELDNDQLCDDEQKNADKALETVMRYGSFTDGAAAIKFHGIYTTFKNLLEG